MTRVYSSRRLDDRAALATGFARPTESRGVVPLIAAAMLAGGARGALGAITANSSRQRNKGYINANYRLASQELDTQQGYAKQDIAEGLNARGMGGMISPIHTAMLANGKIADTGAPSTLGEQTQSDAGVQMALERKDLENQHERALKENKSDYFNALLGSVSAGVNTAASVYTGGKDMGAMGAMGAAGSAPGAAAAAPAAGAALGDKNSIYGSLLSGSAFDGIHPVDPLGDPSSAWHRDKLTMAGQGQDNADFHLGA